MAIVIDAQGNLVDTEGRINFFNTGNEQVFPNQDINQNIPEQTSKAQLESALGPGFYPERGINTLRFANTNSTSLQPNYLLSNTNKIPEFTGNNSAGIFTVPDNDLEENAVTVDELGNLKQSGGIADLFKTLLSFSVPGASFFLNQGSRAMDGIRGLNQRIRNTDFAKSSSLADYFDARRYGGRDERDAAAARNMVQARGIQKKIDRGEYGTASAQDKARGQMPSRTTSAPKRSFSSDYSAAQRARKF
jgi:hypothetical protein